MKFAFSMLKEFVETTKSAVEIGSLLTMAGFELEAIEEVEGEMMLDIKVVSNRGDGLSVLGLAREVLAKDPEAKAAALYERAAERFATKDSDKVANGVSVAIETDECTRYACRIFEGDFNRPSHEWIQKRLRIAGMRPLGLLVDLTNYVMLEVGQPLHAFDLDKLAGQKIIVRKARAGEKLTTLNSDEHTLKSTQMMICDAERPVAAAGIMGGRDTEVTPGTKRILLESAHFVNTSVRRTRKEMEMSTEASYRFERSVDPEGVVAALNRFRELLAEALPESSPSGSWVDLGLIDVYPVPVSVTKIPVRLGRANELLGVEATAEEAAGFLERLGFGIKSEEPQREHALEEREWKHSEPKSRTSSFDPENPENLKSPNKGILIDVTVPSWRPDVVQEYDVVEEIGRVHGYDKIPETPIHGTTTQGGVFGFDQFLEDVRGTAVRLGFIQNISSSLMDASPLDDARGERIGPRHPNSPEMSLLRNSLWPNLADNASRNGGTNLRLFEIGAVFGAPEPNDEIVKLAFLASVGPMIEHWEKQPRPTPSFFSMKTAVEEILRLSSVQASWKPSHDPRLHPTRQSSLPQGILVGQIHPDHAEELGLPSETFLADLDLETVYAHRPETRRFKPISRNPAVRRDIAILIDKAVPYARIEEAIADVSGDLLEKQWLFDVYEGKGIPEGSHSLAIALQIRKMGENLTDEEANQVRDQAVAALAKLGASQR